MPRHKLIIFVKNKEAGQTKTRLAASIGNERALKVYQQLLELTFRQTEKLKVQKEVWYSRFIPEKDIWDKGDFQKRVQAGEDLGQRMAGAFKSSFTEEGFERVVIIGSDCAELTEEVLRDAFDALKSNDFVIGPAEDGGYYLLGMSRLHTEVFEGIEWSTESVFEDTVVKMEELGATFTTLRTLNDVDTVEDLIKIESRL